MSLGLIKNDLVNLTVLFGSLVRMSEVGRLALIESCPKLIFQ